MSSITSCSENKDLKLSLCIICQEIRNEELVVKPTSHERILACIQEWASYGVLNYFESSSKLKEFTAQELEDKGAWHRECYQNVVHTGMRKRAKERYERQLAGTNETRRKTSNVPVEERQLPLTRSKTTPFNSDNCFFCDGSESRSKALFNVRESSSVESLRAAIEKSGNDSLRLKLVTSLDMSDEQATKIRYHKTCWLNNVTNVLRQQQDPTTASNNDSSTSENAAQTEFLAMTEINLREGKILIMSEIQAAYESIRRANNVGNPECSRKALKQLIHHSIPEVQFHRPQKVNESERLSTRRREMPPFILPKRKTLTMGVARPNFLQNTQLLAEKKSLEVHKRALSLAQTTVRMCLTERQRNNKKSEVVQGAREMPQQKSSKTDMYFFAIDNIDFKEDTYDGQGTLHGTAMAIYQKQEIQDNIPELRLEKSTEHRRSIKELLESVTDLLQCPAPASNPAYPANPRFGLFAEMDLPIVVRHEEFAWLLARSMTREVSRGETDEPTQTHEPKKEQVERSGIPLWSGYKYLISDNLHVTRVSTPPLIAAPAHEWNTLLTLLMQAQAINTKVVGPNRKTVISLDMGLYQPAKKLQMHRSDLDHIILRPGELHIVMALL
ncbi:hypothetical protein ACROYT_G028339 [Oculina patagonica]